MVSERHHEQFALRVRYRCDWFWLTEMVCRPHKATPASDHVFAAHAIVFPCTGVFVRHRGGENDIGDPNHIVFFNPDEPYRSSHPGGKGDDCDLLTVRPDVLADLIRPWDPKVSDRSGRLFAFGSHATTARTFLHQRLVLSRLGCNGDSQPVEEAVLALLRRVIEEAYLSRGVHKPRSRTGKERTHAEWVDQVKSILAADFRTGPSIAELSDAVNCSPFHLCRVFKRYAGMPIHQYMNRLRLRVAVEHLRDPRVNLAKLGTWLGYSSHSHFTDAFRREFGVTPTTVRRALSAADVRALHAVLDAGRTPRDVFAELAPEPARAEPVFVGTAPEADDEPPLAPTPYAFRGEPLDPCPYAMPRVPLQPHAA